MKVVMKIFLFWYLTPLIFVDGKNVLKESAASVFHPEERRQQVTSKPLVPIYQTRGTQSARGQLVGSVPPPRVRYLNYKIKLFLSLKKEVYFVKRNFTELVTKYPASFFSWFHTTDNR
jgi:hypothetical protein